MTTEIKIEMYNEMIQKLDAAHEIALSQQEIPTGNNLQRYGQMGRNMAFQRAHELQRSKLVQLLNDATPVSKGVQDYIDSKNKTVHFSKFDVLSGATTIDRSLETEGKPLGKQI